MSTSEIVVERAQPLSPGRAAPAVGIALRFVASIVISAALSLLIWHSIPLALSAHDGVFGYPIFANFNIKRYYDAFYIIVIVFPLLATLAYHLSGLPFRRRRALRLAPVFPVVLQDWPEPRPTGDDASRSASVFWAFVRLAPPALVVALEVSAARSPSITTMTHTGIAAGVAYVVLAIALAAALVRLQGAPPRAQHRRRSVGELATALSPVNALFGLVVVLLLFGVSNNTAIAVGTNSRIVRYPWFPLWLAIGATAVLAWWTIRGLRRGEGHLRGERAERGERRTLIVVVGSVGVFMTMAHFLGGAGPFSGFDDAQYLAGPQLLFDHGLTPWSQFVPFHGLLFDVFGGGFGMVIFGNSRWGAGVGQTLFLGPITWIGLYLFGAYFLRRHRILVAGLAVAIPLGAFGLFTDYRFLLYPFVFMGLCKALETRSPRWSVAFTVLVLIDAIVVPETDLIMAVLLLTIVIFDLSTHQRGTPLRRSFAWTLWCSCTAAVFLICFSVYLLATRSLAAFVDYYRTIISVGNGLEGGQPIGRKGLLITFGGQTSLRYTAELLLPGLLILLTAWLVVAKLRRRSPWHLTQWVMIPAALGVLAYYEEALARLDGGHIQEMFTAAGPLIVLWIGQAAEFVETAVQRYRHRGPGTALRVRYLGPAVALGAIVAVVVCSPVSLGATLNAIPGQFHTSAPAEAPAQVPRLGYTIPGAVDIDQIVDLQRVLDAYAKPDAPVFAFDNDVGVPYYLLNRVPGTRFDNELDAYSPYAQSLMIGDLAHSRPPLVIFTNSTFGLPYVDGFQGLAISDFLHSYNVSDYLLDHYRPLVDVDGQLILIRDDLAGKAPPPPRLYTTPQTTNLYDATGQCAWGFAPNFLPSPTAKTGQKAVHAAVSRSDADGAAAVTGWGVDVATGSAPRDRRRTRRSSRRSDCAGDRAPRRHRGVEPPVVAGNGIHALCPGRPGVTRHLRPQRERHGGTDSRRRGRAGHHSTDDRAAGRHDGACRRRGRRGPRRHHTEGQRRALEDSTRRGVRTSPTSDG